MTEYDDEFRHQEDEALARFLEEHQRELAEAPVFAYLARFGDAIEERVRFCVNESTQLRDAGLFGSALTRSAAGIEISIRHFLVRPLIMSAFSSDEWAALLSKKILKGRTAKDREMLPGILRNWGIDITTVRLAGGAQMWGEVLNRVWPRRNEYVHAAANVDEADARLAAECLDVLLEQVVAPLGKRLGFSREKTGRWSIVNVSKFPELNPPRQFETATPSWIVDES
jgi:hypothetical protein